jgi:hypothetical protein
MFLRLLAAFPTLYNVIRYQLCSQDAFELEFLFYLFRRWAFTERWVTTGRGRYGLATAKADVGHARYARTTV